MKFETSGYSVKLYGGADENKRLARGIEWIITGGDI